PVTLCTVPLFSHHTAPTEIYTLSLHDALPILELASKTTAEHPLMLVNSVNPVRLVGQKTAAWEICDVLGRAPDVHCLPVGNAGNITAYWAGYTEYAKDGVVDSTPRMFGFQAAGASPLVRGEPVANPDTV